jgi:CRISPR-associated protein Cas5d
MNIKTNEVGCKAGKSAIIADRSGTRVQRNSVVLTDVEYVIGASVYLVDPALTKSAFNKYEDIFLSRVKKGTCFRRPFLGMKEFAAEIFSADGDEESFYKGVVYPIGAMFYGMQFLDKEKLEIPLFKYNAEIVGGVMYADYDLNEKIASSKSIERGAQ